MQNKSILSIAILKANWDIRGIDFVENFVPLFLYLLRSKNYNEIKINKLKTDFESEFGLIIPYHPIETILIRIKKKKLLYKKNRSYFFNPNKDNGDNFENIRNNKQRELSKLTNIFIDFCQKAYSFKINNSTAEKALISFFQENGLGLLSATTKKSVFPHIETDKTLKFYVAKFIENAKKTEPEIFKFLTDLAVGIALANSIVYGKDLQNFSGKIGNLNLFLDTGYIFALLGVNGLEKKAAFDELTKTMVDLGTNLFIFEHTYDEVMRILSGALFWINRGNYDIQKASRVLKYFIENDFSATSVEMFIIQVSNILSEHGIKKVPKPSYSENIPYQIDEHKLKKLIIESYRNDPFFDETIKDETINKDIESIYSICKLRKGKISFTLKDASYIFITTNKSLAYISNSVQSADNTPFSISPCITDVLIGTLVWLQNPLKTNTLNEKKLIADAYAAIQPDASLITRYLKEIDSLKKENKISDNEYYVLRTHRVAFNLLSEKTKNDVHNFQSKTTQEIMDEINKKHLFDLKENLKNKEALNKKNYKELKFTKQKLQKERQNVYALKTSNERIIEIIAKIITYIIIAVFIPLILLAIFISMFTDTFLYKIIAFIPTSILSIFGFSFFHFKSWLLNKIQTFINNKVKNFSSTS